MHHRHSVELYINASPLVAVNVKLANMLLINIFTFTLFDSGVQDWDREPRVRRRLLGGRPCRPGGRAAAAARRARRGRSVPARDIATAVAMWFDDAVAARTAEPEKQAATRVERDVWSYFGLAGTQ